MDFKKVLTLGFAFTQAFFLACSDDSSSSSPDVPPESSGTVLESSSSTGEIITSSGSQEIPSDFSYLPVTEGATESAQKLYNFLATNYNVKTIAGMMTGDLNASEVLALEDIEAFYSITGKYPALVGLDFLFATGVKASDSWYQEYTETSIALAKDLWSKGGIPAFTWHWKDPSDNVDAFYTKSGNASEYTDYDFTNGFVDKTCAAGCVWDETSETYTQLVSDIDEISAYFLNLQDAGVAAVFRPIHEASGKWFWWGTKGGAAFQALYQLIYNRMVNVNNVKNLVWVWNPEYAKDVDWNPGNTYYDVLSLDIYEAYDYSTKFVNAHANLVKNFGQNKILAISENGPIPDLSVMKANNSVWSWWMPWYQTWDGNFLDQTVPAVLTANVTSDCAITLDKMPGWDSYSISTTKVPDCVVGYELASLDTARAPIEVDVDTSNGNGWMKVSISGLTEDGILLDYTPKEQLSGITTISAKIKNASLSGVWVSLAIITDDSKEPTWSWQMSTEGCWINAGEESLCELDMTTYVNDDGETLPMEMDRVFKYSFLVSTADYSGDLYIDAFTTNAGVLTGLNSKDELFTKNADKNTGLNSITLVGGN